MTSHDEITRGRSMYEWAILVLTLLPATLGMWLFGSVRLWSIGPQALLIFIALALLLLRPIVFRDVRPMTVAPPAWPFLLILLAYLLVHGFFASGVPYDSWIKWLMIASAAAALWIWTNLAGQYGRWQWLLLVFLVCLSADAWYAVIQEYRGSRMVLNLVRPEGYAMRATGSYFCPNHFANMMEIGLALGLTMIWPKRIPLALRLAAVHAVVMGLYALILSQSRSGALAFLGSVMVILLLVAWRRSRMVFAIAVVAAPLLVAGLGWLGWTHLDNLRERFVRGLDDGGAGRVTMWKGALAMIREEPLLGFGGGTFPVAEPRFQQYAAGMTAVYAHNEVLHAAAEYGIPGLGLTVVFFAAFTGFFLRRLHGAPSDREAMLVASVLGAMAACFIHSNFDYNVHIYANSQAFILLAGCAASVARFGPGAGESSRRGNRHSITHPALMGNESFVSPANAPKPEPTNSAES